MKFGMRIFRKSVEKIQVSLKYNNHGGYITGDLYTLMTIFRLIPLRMRHISDKIVEKIITHILCSATFFPKIKQFMI